MTSDAEDARPEDATPEETGGAPASPTPPAPRPGGPSVPMVAALVLAAVLLLGVAALLVTRGDNNTSTAETGENGPDPAAEWKGVYLEQPQPRPDFTLTDTDGRTYDFAAETSGQLTLLFFGYTSCPDVCPIQMATLAAALEQPSMPDPIVVFVTTDPERDTPERLRSWLDDKIGPDAIGLRGTPEEIRAAEDAAQVPPSVRQTEDGREPGPGEDYEVGHASQVIAYTPDDLAHVLYPFGVRRQDWQADLPKLMATWGDAAESTTSPSGDDSAPAAAGGRVVVGDLAVSGAWATADDVVSAAYLTIDNAGDGDRLVGASTDVAGRTSVMSREEMEAMGHGDASDHEHHPSVLDVPPGRTELAPGGWHIMLEDLRRPLEAGETITVHLEFEHAGTVDVPVEVVTLREATERAADAGGHG